MILPKFSRRKFKWLVLGFGLLAGLLLWVVLRFLSPTPPSRVSLSSGDISGAYHAYALLYQASLAENRVRLDIKPSAGSVENLKRLEAAEVDVAFVQGGLGSNTTDPDREPDDIALRSIAVVAYEPVWIFSRLNLQSGLDALAGKRVSIGVPGSGSRKVALDVLGAYGLKPGGFVGLESAGPVAADELLSGQADAVILVASPTAAVVQKLLTAPGISLASPVQTGGVARQLPYLHALVLPRGAISPKLDLPNQNITLLATTANLVVRKTLHPAVQSLLLEAAKTAHRKATVVSGFGEFPKSTGTDFALSDEAQRYFKDGRPFLQRYLPYWLANFVQRLVLIAIPLFAILIPLFKTLPGILTLRTRSRLYRRYEELMVIERDVRAKQLSMDEISRDRQRLNAIEHDITQAKFPLEFADRIYTLRQHIDYVRLQLIQEEQNTLISSNGQA
jgi:TRAP-type uncharacterized transport system substrate-binding protein